MWKPIETAPKLHSEEFDAWDGFERITNVFWGRPDAESKETRAWCRCIYEYEYGWKSERVEGLTHWIAIPKPPAGV